MQHTFSLTVASTLLRGIGVGVGCFSVCVSAFSS